MNNPQILWADDEIDLLKPHIMFLQKKGYDVITVTNGQDALDYAREHPVDLVFLDENMPGISGLETLSQLKESHPSLPIVMITKSEEEDIMDQAIGSKIADYLIKPVLPNQMLMSIKKNLHAREITQQQQTSGYQQEFGKLSMAISDSRVLGKRIQCQFRPTTQLHAADAEGRGQCCLLQICETQLPGLGEGSYPKSLSCQYRAICIHKERWQRRCSPDVTLPLQGTHFPLA